MKITKVYKADDNAITEVEKLGSSQDLTTAVIKLFQAKELVGTHIDSELAKAIKE